MISLEAIIVIGLARSGKDTVAEYLERKHGYKKLVFSDLISEELQRQGLEVNKTNMSNIANDMRTQHGMDVLAKRMVEKMKKMREEKFVLVGPRSPEELSYVKKNCSKCIALKVETEREERFERKSEKDPVEMGEFFKRDKNDIENKGLGKLLLMADHTIANNSTINDLEKAIDEVIEKV